MLAIVLAGVFALFNLQMRINPKWEESEINVNIPFPGASPVEVEEGVIIKIEEALKGLEGLEKVTSTSSENWGSLSIEVDQDYDIDRAIQEVKNAVNSISSYPLNAEQPVVTRNTGWNRAIMISIYGPDDLLVTKRIVDEFRDELLKTGKVSMTRIWGIPDREISIEISPENLIRYKLTIDEIAMAVRNASLNISSGSVLTDQEQILIRSYGKKYEAEEFRDIEVISGVDGSKVYLSDICSIEERWPENMFYSEFNGNRSVSFNAMYNNNEDVVEIVELTEALARKYEEKYEGLITFKTFIKETDDLEERMNLLTRNGAIGLFFVLIGLGVFLNVRLAFWVALGIPISFFGLFFVMMVLGISINEMSLFGMILVVGILVDDGIIIGESIYSQFEKGKRAFEAAIEGTLEVIKPVSISILTTIVAFIPYFYFYGRLGDYMWQIGAVVIICLAFSLVEAIIILPSHLAHSRAISKRNHPEPSYIRIRIDRVLKFLWARVYSSFLKFCLKYRWTVIAANIAIIMIILGMFAGSHVKAVFFPEIEFPFARLRIEMPAGTSAEIASKVRHDILDKSLELAELWEERTGKNPIENVSSWEWGGINVFLDLIPATERDWSVNEFSDELSEFIGSVPEADNINIGSGHFGGQPIAVKFLSSDSGQLMKAKELMKAELKEIAGVKNIRDDTPLGNNEFIVSLKPNAKTLGFTLRDITTQLRHGFYGQEVMRMQRGRDEIKIWVRFNKENRLSISQVENLKIRTPSGDYVPIKEVADFRLERGLKQIRREEGSRSVTVSASLDHSKNDLNVVLKDLNDNIVPEVMSHVEGVTRAFGGQSEFADRAQESIRFTMAIAFFAIFTILMFLLKSYIQTFLIMGLIPLGIIGAVIGHFIIGIPVSILSFLGMVALAGIIINDSVVLMDRYNNLIKSGMDVPEAIYEAAMARFRAIVLTTLTTAFGLAPLILLRSAQGQFLVPMAASVAFGLIFGTVITLLMLPATVYCVSDIRKMTNYYISHKLLGKEVQTRNELEPGRK